MPVSQCTRCDQLIDYDASHEGEEVLCPACDNITRLQAVPGDPLLPGAGEGVPGRVAPAPIRLAAEELPKPGADPVAPVGAPDGIPDPRESMGDLPPSTLDGRSAVPADVDRKLVSSPAEERSHHGIEIRIIEGDDASGDEALPLASTEGDELRLRLPLNRPWLLVGLGLFVLALVFVSVRFVHRKVEESRPLTESEVQAILATQPRVGLPDSAPPPRPRVEVATPPAPNPEAGMESRRPLLGATPSAGAKDTVDVRFPTLPTRLTREPARSEAEAYRFYVDMAFSEPFRLFGDMVIDLRTLRFAAGAGMIDYPDDWRLLGGVAQGLDEAGLQLRLDRRFYPESGVVLVTDFPKAVVVQRDQPLGLLLRRTGSRRVKLADGEDRVVETYEFGMRPSEPMVKVAQLKAAERETATRREMEAIARRQADEAALEEEKRKQAREAGTIRFLRSRVAQGSASAQYQLGLRFLEGRGVPANREEGLRLLRASAVQNYRSARMKLKDLGLEK